MRTLFATYPSVAHLLPIVPLAWAMQNAGHEVRIASHHTITEAITNAGLTMVPLGRSLTHEARNREGAPSPKDPEDVLNYSRVLGLNEEELEHWIAFYQYLLVPLADYVRPGQAEVEDLIEFARQWQPDLVLWDAVVASAPVAARLCGAAHARLLVSTDRFSWCLNRLAERRADLAAAGLSENPLADVVRPLADKYGLELDHELLVGQWTVSPTPVGVGPSVEVKTVRLRQIPYSGGGDVPAWLTERPQRPRVALSLGESNRRFIPGDWDRLERILAALDGLDIEVVATLNALQLQAVERVPDNVRVVEWVPLTQLLPTCSAIIHHGGVGTFAAACAHRVPQLICDTDESIMIWRDTSDLSADDTGTYQLGRELGVREEEAAQAPRWVMPAKNGEATPLAAYVTRLGAGERLNFRALTIDEIGALVTKVATDPAYRRGADDMYQVWLATPGPADVVATLENLVTLARR